jgi:hypothetical protein
MFFIIRWVIIFGLIGAALFAPLPWIGQPRETLALGILVGAVTSVGLDTYFPD